MNNKLFKRIGSCLLVFCICYMNNNIALAEEKTQENEFDIFEETTMTIDETSDNLSIANVSDVVTVPARGYADLYPRLDSYMGFNKKFIVNASTEGESTLLFLYLYDPNGNLKSDDWIMGSNELVEYSLFLPSSGQWRLRVVASASDTPVRVFAKWE